MSFRPPGDTWRDPLWLAFFSFFYSLFFRPDFSCLATWLLVMPPKCAQHVTPWHRSLPSVQSRSHHGTDKHLFEQNFQALLQPEAFSPATSTACLDWGGFHLGLTFGESQLCVSWELSPHFLYLLLLQPQFSLCLFFFLSELLPVFMTFSFCKASFDHTG